MLPLNRSRSRSRFFPVGVPSAPTDPFWSDVSLLLNTTSTNGAQNNTFLDSSANAFSVTRNGNTTQGTFSPFSQTGWSNFFDGTGDYLSVPDNAAWAFGTGDFTLEAWIYFTVGSTYQRVISQQQSSGSTGIIFRLENNNKLAFYINGSAVATSTTTLTVNQWYHVAVARSGTSLKLFVNGAQEVSVTNSTSISNIAEVLTIGAFNISGAGTGEFFNGYISNARIVTGTAVYTSNFTPPTAPLTAISGTSLLTCQSNRFIDNSSNAFAITRNGDVRVEAFSPFNPTAAWSASTNGGSGYFDGTGDYLSAASNAAFDILSGGDFTVECWFYANSLPNNSAFGSTLISRDNTGATAGFIFRVLPTALEWVYPGLAANSQSFTFVTNIWYHVAAVRSSGAFRLYINGTQYSPTYSDRTADSATAVLLGASTYTFNTAPFTGYISNARVVKGTAVYTSNFTPPTAPLTAITNTSLLLNFTNAGIYDSAAKNDLETVGNAQVSTTQAKWGATSMAFDGTGDWLTVIDKPVLRFGTGAFTVEGWLYLGATGAARGIVGKGTSTTGWLLSTDASDKVVFTYGTSTIVSTGALSGSTWYYIAVVREGTGANQTKIYINGTNDGTGTVSTDFNQTSIMYVGANRTGGDALNGYIDDLRITNGVARYTGNFTPPTAAFPLN